MPLTLGSAPDELTVVLVPGADFVETLETLSPDQAFPQPWPTGSVLSLTFGDGVAMVEWVAAISSNLVSWAVESPDVDAVIDDKLQPARLWYTNGTVKLLLAVGGVEVYG